MILSERAALLGLSARELVAGAAPWFTDELAATESARERLRAWASAGGLTRPVSAIRNGLQYFGDKAILPLVVDALSRVPPPVLDAVLRTVAIYGVGWRLRGFAMVAPLDVQHTIVVHGETDRDGDLDAAQVVKTTLHEIAHIWLEHGPDPPSESGRRPITTAAEIAVLELAAVEGWAHFGEHMRRAKERRACHLADRWRTA